MNRLAVWVPALLVFSLVSRPLVRAAQIRPSGPTGWLAYLRSSAAYRVLAAGGPERLIPGVQGAEVVSLSPGGDALLFFTGRPGSDRPLKGFIRRSPFIESRSAPPPLDRVTEPEVLWSPDGSVALVTGVETYERTSVARYESAGDRVHRESLPADGVARAAKVIVWRRDHDRIWAREARDPGGTALFSVARPEPLLAALRRARYRSRLGELASVPRASWSVSRNWSLGTPAVSPDGSRVYFAANAGSGVGATGGTTFCFVTLDRRTRALSVLSRLGARSGRVPEECSVSPDGRRLLLVYVKHGSAVVNERYVRVVDLATQRSRELLHHRVRHERRETNLTWGPACWSPDGRYLALDVAYYDAERAEATDEVPGPEEFSVQIFGAATGQRVRTIPGARGVSWSR